MFRRYARQYDAVPEVREERMPERIVFEHIEYTRDTDHAAFGFRKRKRTIAEHTFVFVIIQIRYLVFLYLKTDAAFTTVTDLIFAAAREVLHRDNTLVTAFVAAIVFRVMFKMRQLFSAKQCRTACRGTAFRDDGDTVRPHQARDIGTDDFATEKLFHRTKHSIVVERTALYDDLLPKLFRMLDTDNFKERVFHDRHRQTCGDIGNRRAFFLRLFYF